MTRLVAFLALSLGSTFLLSSCAKGGGPVAGPVPRQSPGPRSERGTGKEGPLVTAGARCQSGKCVCREVDNYGRPAGEPSSEGDIAPGHKRFEFRTGRGFDHTSVTIESRGTLVKDMDLPEPSCAYVDLQPGTYRVVMRAEAKDKTQGIQPRLVVGEYGAETHDWYDTFAFACGNGAQRCIKDDMNEWFAKVRTRERGIFDRCGAARIDGLRWSVEHSPEQTLEDLTLEFTLRVYKFAPRFKHGNDTCKGLAGGRAAEEQLADPNGP